MKLLCRVCGEEMYTWTGGPIMTLVGYNSPEGHDHDDNCKYKVYHCKNGHHKKVYKISKCPACDWVGKRECWCHDGPKYDEWPEGARPDFDKWWEETIGENKFRAYEGQVITVTGEQFNILCQYLDKIIENQAKTIAQLDDVKSNLIDVETEIKRSQPGRLR